MALARAAVDAQADLGRSTVEAACRRRRVVDGEEVAARQHAPRVVVEVAC